MPFFILTGGPGCGKSTVALHLEMQHGKRVVHEAAESVIRVKQAQGIKQPWTMPSFQREIWELQNKRMLVNSDTILDVFLDRYFVDAIAYSMETGTRHELPADHEEQLDRDIPVFFFESLDTHEQNSYRCEDRQKALEMSQKILDLYRRYGFKVIIVPKGSVDERSGFVLKKVEELTGRA